MANEEHLKILKQGVDTWNKWREDNPNIKPDLSKAALAGENFVGINLEWSNLVGVDLSEARLNHAKLAYATISDANFTNTNLHSADIRATTFRHSILKGAMLYNTVVGLTTFAGVDLSEVKGLDTIFHLGPSLVGIDTIYKSNGKIPEPFLRGCGVPDSFIEYMDSLITANKPWDYYSCFISCSNDDKELAERLFADLQTNNVRCWFAREHMKIGDKIRDRLDEAIKIYDKLLLILSKNSIDSSWVEKEVETALEKEKKQGKTVLFPIRLDNMVMYTDKAWAADIRRTRNIGDFNDWKDHDSYKNAFDRLLRDLKAVE